nr:hypothetical protein [Sphingomonas panni]
MTISGVTISAPSRSVENHDSQKATERTGAAARATVALTADASRTALQKQPNPAGWVKDRRQRARVLRSHAASADSIMSAAAKPNAFATSSPLCRLATTLAIAATAMKAAAWRAGTSTSTASNIPAAGHRVAIPCPPCVSVSAP